MQQQVVADRYQLNERLGIGGQGQVFRARDLVTGATVAVKLMEHDSPESNARFRLEGRLAARIRDPHLVAALHYGTWEGQNFIVFDYIPGVAPVTKLLLRRVEPDRVCELALQVLDALASLHDAGVVHQDVAPGNCLWRERDTGRLEVFVVDLGSAASRSPVTGGPAPSWEPVGTANYMAPEMMSGEMWDHRVDLWSVGALMYRLLTGDEVDIDPDEPLEIPAPAQLDPSIPKAVSDVVMGALTEATDRFPSANLMADAIRRALAVPAPPPPRAGIPKRDAFGAMVLVAVFAVLGTVAAHRISVAAPERPAAPETTLIPEPVAAAEPTLITVAVTPETVTAPEPAAAHRISVATSERPAAPERPVAPETTLIPEPVAAASPPEPTLITIAVTPETVAAPEPAAHQPLGPVRLATGWNNPDDRGSVVRVPSALPHRAARARRERQVKRTKPTRWATVHRAVKGKAHELGPCSVDDHISLGLRISKGRATLTTVNGAAVSPTSHHCVREVIARWTFPHKAELVGVVGVPLTD